MAEIKTEISHGFVATPHGRIHYLESGTGDPLILLHSNGCSANEYQDVIGPLSQTRRVIAWDMPGHGDSDALSTHMQITDYADAVVALMDALGIEKADVAGSSVGGTICVDLGVRYPDRFTWTVLVETPIRSLQDWLDGWDGIDTNFGVPTQSFEQIAHRFRALTPERLTRWNIDRNKAGGKTMVAVMWALRDYDILSNLSTLAQTGGNTAVIYGADGPTIASVAHFERQLPNAPSIILDACGHFPMTDDPAAFAKAMQSILG